MLYTSVHNDFDVQTHMDKISMPVCLKECSFSKITSLRTENRRPLPRMLFRSFRLVQ